MNIFGNHLNKKKLVFKNLSYFEDYFIKAIINGITNNWNGIMKNSKSVIKILLSLSILFILIYKIGFEEILMYLKNVNFLMHY